MSITGIIILHWNNTAEVNQLLQEVTLWDSSRYDIVVVDNSGDFENSFNAVQCFSPAQNLGFAGGCNFGMQYVMKRGCKFVLLLNADVAINETDIKRLLYRIKSDDSLAAVAPVLMERKDGQHTFHKGGRNPLMNSNTRIVAHKLIESTDEAVYLPGTVLLLRTQAIEQIGFLDENYFFSGEIADWFLTLQRTTWKFDLLKDVVVEHFSSGNESYRKKHYIYYSLRNRYLLIRKFGGNEMESLIKNWDGQLRRQMIGALIRFDFSKFLTIYQAVRDGKSGKFGKSNKMLDN